MQAAAPVDSAGISEGSTEAAANRAHFSLGAPKADRACPERRAKLSMCQGAAEPAKETLAGQRGKEDEKSGKGEKSRREGRRLASALDSKNTGVKLQPCPH